MKKINLIIVSLGLIFLMSITSVIGQNKVNDLYCCLSPAPIIDGSFYSTAIEWDKGVPIDVELFNINDQADRIKIQIQSVQDNDYRIFFGVTIPNTVIEGDTLYLVFRDVEGQPIHLPPHDISGKYGKDHDVIAMYMHNNHTVDMFTDGIEAHTAYPSEYIADTDAGGTNDGIGKCYINGTHVTVETQKQFNTGDSLGNDFNLVVNGSIDMFIWFFDGDLAKHYSMIRKSDNDYDYLLLHVQCTKAVPVSIGVIITGIFVTATGAVILKKRRK
ncbi:MAG: hypothetical protein FK730_09110 [Asgard group archaeon]|nr:hypothetical protein [Asgard group archaeon]